MSRKVYLDSIHAGLVPAVLTSVNRDRRTVGIKITANRGAYQRGEVHPHIDPRWVIPREYIIRRNGKFTVSSAFRPSEYFAA